jgi:hypothetical protein
MVPEAPVLESAVPNSYGTVTLCKQTDGGIAAGTPYEFTVTLNGVVRKITVPVGQCLELVVPRSAEALSKGYYRTHADVVAALLPNGAKLRVDGSELTGDQVMAIFAAPARGSSDVDVGGSTILLNLVQQLLAADLNLLQGVQPTPAVLDAVAAANAGVTITIVAGVVRITSSLSQTDISRLVDVLTRFNDGKSKGTSPTPTTAELRIVETLPSQVTLASIVCAPTTGCTNANLATASVTVLASAGSATTVTYKNNSQTLGTLRLCKVAGTGIEAGAPFEFRVGATDATVEAGSCEDLVLPFNNTGDSDGRYGIFEFGCGDLCLGGDDGFAVTRIDCTPTARCGTASLTVGTIRVRASPDPPP